MGNVNAGIRFDAPQVVGNLIIVTGRVDNSQIFNTADGATHNKGFIDVSNFMREVLSFRYVSTQPIDLQPLTLGTNLDDSSGTPISDGKGGFTNEVYINVPVIGGSGTGMQVARVTVDTSTVANTMRIQDSNLIYSSDKTEQSAAGRGYQVGEVVTLNIPTTSGTDKPKFRIVPAGMITDKHPVSPDNLPAKNLIYHTSSQPARQVTRPGVEFIEERNKVYLRGPITNEDLTEVGGIGLGGAPTAQVGVQLPQLFETGEPQRVIFGHFKFIIIGRR